MNSGEEARHVNYKIGRRSVQFEYTNQMHVHELQLRK